MKKLKIFYNPFSGDGMFKSQLDKCIAIFQKSDYDVSFFRSLERGDIDEYMSKIKPEEYDAFVVAGGDGTINIIVNAIMKYSLQNTPLGIIPSGTANDFATFLKLEKNVEMCCEVICEGRTQTVDLGLINDEKYFINVCAGGLFSNISTTIDPSFKNTLGKIGYYIKAFEQIPTFTPLNMRITANGKSIEEKFDLFIVLNSSGTGGLENLSPTASVSDGLFDFLGIKNIGVGKIMPIILKYFKGERFIGDNQVVFFRASEIMIENLSENSNLIQTDIDGEEGPEMPVKIKNIHKALKIFY
jgi:YegS/Rv2252/BmrU family lipid kinase